MLLRSHSFHQVSLIIPYPKCDNIDLALGLPQGTVCKFLIPNFEAGFLILFTPDIVIVTDH